METLISKRLLIRGRVQGVGYRAAMREEGRRLQLKGWVRNCADGTVEALIKGSTNAVETMVNWAKTGSQFSNVEHIEITSADAPDSQDFVIRCD